MSPERAASVLAAWASRRGFAGLSRYCTPDEWTGLRSGASGESPLSTLLRLAAQYQHSAIDPDPAIESTTTGTPAP